MLPALSATLSKRFYSIQESAYKKLTIRQSKFKFPYLVKIFIPLETRLQPNIGFTLRGDLAVFTRSAVTPIWIKSGVL